MKKIILLVLSTLFTTVFAQENVSSLNYGSMLLTTPASYVDMTERNLWAKYSAGALLDETTNPWCSKNTKFPFVFVIELTEEFNINSLKFNNICENYPGIETKDIKVEFSTISVKNDFTTIGVYSLKKGEIQKFDLSPQKCRWIKLTILSNHGHKDWVELAEFEAIGTPSKKIIETINIDGEWKTNWQNIYFKQNGNQFTGSYAYGSVTGNVKNGKIDRNKITFDWDEGALVGTATLYLNSNGNQLSGKWQNSRSAGDNGLWTMSRNLNKPIIFEENIEKPKPAENETFIFNGEEKKIGDQIVLKNVLFHQAKAELLASSYAELDKLVEFLVQNPDFKIELSGHTDNQGSIELNTKLSQERVKTVTNYLIQKGINHQRISGEGYGPTKPISDNSTEELRKLNRRVEFSLKKI